MSWACRLESIGLPVRTAVSTRLLRCVDEIRSGVHACRCDGRAPRQDPPHVGLRGAEDTCHQRHPNAASFGVRSCLCVSKDKYGHVQGMSSHYDPGTTALRSNLWQVTESIQPRKHHVAAGTSRETVAWVGELQADTKGAAGGIK